MRPKIAVIVNKTAGHLAVSETFIEAHINGLPCETVAVVGNPGKRAVSGPRRQYLQSRALIPLGLRWAIRQSGLTDTSSQDCGSLRRFLGRQKIDAVLAEYGTTAISVMDACSSAQVPLIAHFHGWDAYSDHLVKMHGNDYRLLFDRAAAIVAVSSHMRSQLISMGSQPERTFHNACGADLPVGQRSRPAEAKKRFLMVGRLTEKKAPFLTLLAYKSVCENHKDAFLDVVGDGPLRQACQQLCKALSIDDRVTFHGAQPHSRVFEMMRDARGFLQHSVTSPNGDREGTPVGVLEAMGMGLPVVATRHGGILDIIESGRTGWLVDEYDVRAMADAINVLAGDSEKAAQLGANARDMVLRNWTVEKSNARLWNIIAESASLGSA